MKPLTPQHRSTIYRKAAERILDSDILVINAKQAKELGGSDISFRQFPEIRKERKLIMTYTSIKELNEIRSTALLLCSQIALKP